MTTKSTMQDAQLKAGCCARVCGAMLLVVGGIGLAVYLNFTPVYKPITCHVDAGLDGFQSPGIEKLLPGSPGWQPPWEDPSGVENLLQGFSGNFLHNSASQSGVSLNISLTCSNPNPISVHINKARGTVYAGADRTLLGTMTALPTSYMPAHSTGSIQTKENIRLDPSIAAKILPQLILRTGLPIWFQLNGTATISLSFLSAVRASPSIQMSCGMHLASVSNVISQPTGPLVGPMSCADSFDNLGMKPVDAPKDNKTEKLLALAESVKNVICGTMMFLGFICGPILLFSGRWCFCNRQQASDASASKGDARKTAKSPALPTDGDGVEEV